MGHINTNDHRVPVIQKAKLLWEKLIRTARFEIKLERNVGVILCTFVELIGKNTDRVNPSFDICPELDAGYRRLQVSIASP